MPEGNVAVSNEYGEKNGCKNSKSSQIVIQVWMKRQILFQIFRGNMLIYICEGKLSNNYQRKYKLNKIAKKQEDELNQFGYMYSTASYRRPNLM